MYFSPNMLLSDQNVVKNHESKLFAMKLNFFFYFKTSVLTNWQS